MQELKQGIKNFWEKAKSIKHFNIIVALIVGVILCLVYFSFFSGHGAAKTQTDNSTQNSTQAAYSETEYIAFLENRLNNVLSQISGVGAVSSIVTLKSGFTYEYATQDDTRTTTSGSVTTVVETKNFLFEDDKPVLLKVYFPEIKGVMIVAKGAEDFAVKLNIYQAVQNLLEISREDITILS